MVETNAELPSSVPAPVAFSTVQTANEFTFQKFDTLKEDREFYLGPHTTLEELREKINDYYALDELITFLNENQDKNYNDITLQFPDPLIKDSTFITNILQDKFAELKTATSKEEKNTIIPKFWVLADTAYSACCVDEVAAEHVNADLVVHFGDACLNAIQKLPVVYSLGRPYLPLHDIIEKFKTQFPDKSSKVCLMSNSAYTLHMKPLFDHLTDVEGYENLIYSQINAAMASDQATILGEEHSLTATESDKCVVTLGSRLLFSRNQDLTIGNGIQDDEETLTILQNEYDLFHLTVPQDPHLLYLTTVFKSVVLYDNKNENVITGPFPSMMKRYKYMSVARTAGCIGILVNTLSLRNTKETINQLTKLIRNSGKKHYLFVVGKPNVAKLANFEPVDIWCILGCSQSGIIIDQINEFYKPIITPYELTMALNDEVTWTGKWVVDFKKALEQISDQIDDQESKPPSTANMEESEAPEFDVVTGKYVSTSRPLRNVYHLELESPSENSGIQTRGDSSNQVIKRTVGGDVIKGTVSTSVSHLQSRNWKGLGSDFSEQDNYEEEGATVEQGISGVARGYGFDRTDAIAKKNAGAGQSK
ncbi:2-(3-amino-3-carboxypropyl)histidine synthase NDAI_0D04650 [Naumovozyma dairenensis CBS 421]|uniref:2-(3-amino-3-carboxypropyl)histidine synthase subunit 2 n=1 Tax=Naumovozyma dairenensis (strain ATCC 10597 / BCRC 20456 / CBS 421 / NBRC 0211 / NRRL Y-12639) TaxID=1071378 RepID=G0WAG7_NAUDC|nr:hypothetical protein NDAI_0D04650 [Naumovozyma dairenensis CBS 421]CCD24778.1 hypothetical protein NDAI_0D04650 [Naumovozyma dairenensis CBS 421]